VRLLVVIAALAVCGACYVLEQRLDQIERKVSILTEEARPMTFTWNTAGPGDTITEVVLAVPRDPQWTMEEWQSEAASQLVAMQTNFPPVD